MNPDRPTKAAELRRRAQERLQARTAPAPALNSAEDFQRLHHELQVHQIELELQNEELVAARDRAEEATARYTDLYDFAPLAYFTLERKGRITRANLAGARLLGSDRVRLLDYSFREFVVASDWPAFEAHLQRVFADQPNQTCEVTLATKRPLPVRARIEMTLAPNGLECGFLVVDITEIVRTATALRQTQFSMDHAPVPVVWIQADGRYAYANAATCRLLGYTPTELLGKTVAEINPDMTLLKWQANWSWLKQHGCLNYEGAFVTHDGHRVPVEIAANYLEFEGREFCCGFARDIRERKRAEAEKAALETAFHQAQKTELVGQLAGGVAHDFNNILCAITMESGLLLGNAGLDHPTREGIEAMARNAQRAAAIARRLLLFSRRAVVEMAPLDLTEAVSNLLSMLRRLVSEQIHLQFDGGAALPRVEGDVGLLEQVITNLVLNARDALASRISIALTATQANAERVQGRAGVSPGPFVCLAVNDNGSGMDAATRQHLFEPYFTTKPVGQGTGLGLATVLGIVAQHKGWVEVESELGAGTTFRVFLPATTKPPMPAAPAPSAPPPGGAETILLVEDEPSVRRGLAQVLRRWGYTVLEAEHGQQALQTWREHAGPIDLLFADMIMPGKLTGLDLAAEFRREQPGLPVIISSGYSTELHAAETPAALEGVKHLQKPYALPLLARTLRECLDGR